MSGHRGRLSVSRNKENSCPIVKDVSMSMLVLDRCVSIDVSIVDEDDF